MAVPYLTELESALRRLEAVETRLDREVGPRSTLDPARDNATQLHELLRSLAPRAASRSSGTLTVLAEGLERSALAIVEHFPGNLFWDLDALAAALVTGTEDPASLRDAFRRVVRLHGLFGRGTTIRFRYVHDFIYGFDWAKWVRRGPPERSRVGPFDPRYLAVLERRGHELLALIDADDEKYPRLPGAQARNPFAFSREPDDERRLHRALAADGLIPVEAWTLDPTARWDRPFADLRDARATAL